jgi:hypothetical protein
MADKIIVPPHVCLMNDWIRELAAAIKQLWFLPTRQRPISHTCSMDYIAVGLAPNDMYIQAVTRLGPRSQDITLAIDQVLSTNIPLELHPLVWVHLGNDQHFNNGQWRRLDVAPSELAKIKRDRESTVSYPKICPVCKGSFCTMSGYNGHVRTCHQRVNPKTNPEWLVMPAVAAAGVGTRASIIDLDKSVETAKRIIKVEATLIRPPAWPIPSHQDDLTISVHKYEASYTHASSKHRQTPPFHGLLRPFTENGGNTPPNPSDGPSNSNSTRPTCPCQHAASGPSTASDTRRDLANILQHVIETHFKSAADRAYQAQGYHYMGWTAPTIEQCSVYRWWTSFGPPKMAPRQRHWSPTPSSSSRTTTKTTAAQARSCPKSWPYWAPLASPSSN